MKIVPTFTKSKKRPSNLWAACYLEDYEENGKPRSIFSKLFDCWNDRSYLLSFFKKHKADLASPYWKGLSIAEAIDQVVDEALDFENELKHIELQLPGYENYTLQDIFHQLHKHEFSLKPHFSRFRKGKPNFPDAMLRLYAIELDENGMVVSGGAIKLTEKMDRPHLVAENKRLIQLQDFLNSHGIYSKEGLI